jgi:hypothetical protein
MTDPTQKPHQLCGYLFGPYNTCKPPPISFLDITSAETSTYAVKKQISRDNLQAPLLPLRSHFRFMDFASLGKLTRSLL